MKKIFFVNILTISSLCCFSQTKKAATQVAKTPVMIPQKTAPTFSANDMFNAINVGEYMVRPTIVNNNAPLQIMYSPLAVIFDFIQIRTAANSMRDELQERKQPINPFVAQLADMSYRNHVEFLPMDGVINVTFIKPNLSIDPKNVTTIPTTNPSGQLKYRLSN